MKNDEVEVSTKSHNSGKTKKLKWILIISAGCGLLIFFGLPLFLSSAAGTNLLLGKINQSVDGQVRMDDFSIGWFKGVKLENLSYDDSSGNTSVTVRQLTAQPKLTSLLSDSLKLGRTVIEGPQIHLKVTPEQMVPTPKASKPSADGTRQSKPHTPVRLEQLDLQVIDGTATIELAGEVPQTLQFSNIASKIQVAPADAASSIELAMDVDQTANISAKGKVTPSNQGWTLADGDFSVQIDKLELASLKPLFAMAGQNMDMAGQLNADAKVQFADGKLGQLKATARIDNFAQGTGDQRIAFKSPVIVSAATSGSGEAMAIESLEIESDFCKVHCSGTQTSLDYDVDADLAQTLHFAGQFADLQGYSAAGRLNAKGNVNMSQERINVTATGGVQQLIVQKDALKTPLTDAALNLNCAVDNAAGQLQLASLDLTATPGTVNIANLAVPLSMQGLETVSMDASANLDLAKAWPFVQIFADVPADLQLAGVLDSAVKISTQDSQIRLLTEKTTIEKLQIARAGDEPFTQDIVSLRGDIVLHTEQQKIDIRQLNLQGTEDQSLIKVSKGSVEKLVSQHTTRLKGDFEAAYDLETLLAFGSAFIPDGLTLQGKRNDILRFESVYPTDKPEQMAKNLNAAATFGFEKAAYNGLNFGNTELAVEIVDGVAEFEIPQAVVNEGKFQFAGQVDLNEDIRTLRLKEPMRVLDNIHITEELTNTMLKYLSPAFARQTNISGFATLSCNQLEIPFDAEQRDALLVDGIVQIDKMRLKAIGLVGDILERTDNRSVFDAKLLPSRILLQDGVMQYDEMEFHFDQYPIGFFGKIYLDKRLDMKALVPYKIDIERSIPVSAVHVGENLSKRLKAPVDGTVDRPKISIGKVIEENLKGNSEDLIRWGIELLENL